MRMRCDIFRANIVLFGMREHFPPSGSSEPADAPGAGTAAAFGGLPGAGDAGNAPPLVPPAPAAGLFAARLRTRMIWLLAGAMAVATAIGATAIVRKIQADHALNRVARVALVPHAGAALDGAPERAPAILPAAVAQAGTLASAREAPREVPLEVPVGAPPPDAADGKAGPGSAAQVLARAPADAVTDRGSGESGVAKPSAAKAAKSRGALDGAAKAKAAKAGVAKNKRAKAPARRAGAGDTFKRCPPLGRKGAVMCRWHICNGAAGKEAACRPYLERTP